MTLLERLKAIPPKQAIIGGVAAACVLGAGFGFLSRPTYRDDVVREERAAVKIAYAPPDVQQIAGAYAEARQVLALEGVSGLARRAQSCFRDLEKTPSFGLMDFCVALDAYGVTAYRTAGGPPPPASWFGQADDRDRAAVERLVTGQGDASSRLLDIRRLAAETARRGGVAAAVPAVAAAPPAGPLQIELVDTPPPATPPGPPPPSPEPVSAPAPSPAPTPRERVVVLGPTSPRVTRSRADAQPSFNCRYARSPVEQQVCDDPVLARADRHLARVFDRAMRASPDPRALRAEQDRWLRHRERAGPDPHAVLEAYDRRIAELEAEQDGGPW
jgi:uncharacterized protein YecT (DUF1311 family)